MQVEILLHKPTLGIKERMCKMSDFGKGFIICLLKWAEHLERCFPTDKSTTIRFQMMVATAKDHLYEIEVPEGEKWDGVRDNIGKLTDGFLRLNERCLEDNIVFNFKGPVSPTTLSKFFDLQDLAHEIAVEVDRIIGIRDGDKGTW